MSTPTLLIIQPAGPTRDLVCATAEGVGFAVHVCGTGIEGLAAFRQRPPDVLLASLDLLDMDGLTLVTTADPKTGVGRVWNGQSAQGTCHNEGTIHVNVK